MANYGQNMNSGESEMIGTENITRIIGLDVANSTLKIWTNELNLKYVNTIRQINDAGLVYSFKTDYQMYVYDKQVYEVGILSATGSGGRGVARYSSEDFKIEALINSFILLGVSFLLLYYRKYYFLLFFCKYSSSI